MTLQSMGHAADASDAIGRRIKELAPWFHNLHLPDGRGTAPDHPLGDFPSFKWEAIAPALPGDMTGWTALDIGCNAGFYTFEVAKRGAQVLAIDHDDHYLRQARWAADIYDLRDRVMFERMGVYDLAHVHATFDIVFFMGVLYHLRYPLLAIDIVAEKVSKMLVFQTLTMPDDDTAEVPPDLSIDDRDRMLEPGWPKMAFIEHALASDPTNWWAANSAAVAAMIRSAGLEVVRSPAHEIFICRPTRRRAFGVTTELDAATNRSESAPG